MGNNTNVTIGILDLQENWNVLKTSMKEKYRISDISFDTWIKPMEAAAVLDGNKIVIWLPAPGNKEMILKFVKCKYQEPWEETIRQHYASPVAVFFFVSPETLDEEEVKKVVNTGREEMLPFNPLFSFDNFVVGTNKSAYEQAIELANNRKREKNISIFTGTSGVGKTHLLNSIARTRWENDSSLKIKYLNAESFIDDIICTFRSGDSERIANIHKRNSADLLIVDDIDAFSGKPFATKQFLEICDKLSTEGKHVILAGKLFIPDLFLNLIERATFIEVTSPDPMVIREILKKQVQNSDQVGDDIINHIACFHADQGLKSAKACLMKILQYQSYHQTNVTLPLAKSILDEFVRSHIRV